MKIKVTIDGVEKEIELDDEKYMTREQHETRLKTVVQQRLNRQAAGVRKELLADEGFKSEALAAWNVDPKGGKGGKEGEAEIVARVQNEIRTREVEPLKQQVAQLSTEIDGSRRDQLVSDLTESFIAAGVKKGMARRLAEVEVNRGVFGFDKEQQKGWAVKDGDGFAFAPNATKDRPFKGPKEFAEDWAKDKSNADFLERTTQQGPGLGGTGVNTGTVRTRADLKSETEKVAFIKEHGFEKFSALPDK